MDEEQKTTTQHNAFKYKKSEIFVDVVTDYTYKLHQSRRLAHSVDGSWWIDVPSS